MIPWAVQTLAATTLLMAIVLMLRLPAGRAFGARSAYALWALPGLRMILPPLPGWRALMVPALVVRPHATMVGLVDPATAARLAPALPEQAALVTPVPLIDPAPAAVAHPWGLWLAALWLGGAALWFGWQMLHYHLFLRRALARAVPLTTEYGIDVLVSDAIAGPAATGIWRRRILLPADFLARYAPDERRLALLHEAAHHDRRDIVANLAALIVVALHWWNPLAHRAYRAFRADQELACDATVLADRPEARATYGAALLKSAVASTPSVACALNAKAQLRRRLQAMRGRPMGRVRLVAGGLLALGLVGAGTLATASGLAAQPETIAPLPPAPPLPPMPPQAPLPPLPPRHLGAADREALAEARHQARLAARAATLQARAAAMEGDAARRQAEAARQAAELARRRVAAMDVHGMVEASLAHARAGLAAACAASGVRIDPSADLGELATCGPRLRQQIRASLAQARAGIAQTAQIDAAARTQALAGIDRAMTDLDRPENR